MYCRKIAAGPFPRVPVAVYDSGWHMVLRDLKAEIVLRDISAWIADPELACLPSGALRTGDSYFGRRQGPRLAEALDDGAKPMPEPSDGRQAMLSPAAAR